VTTAKQLQDWRKKNPDKSNAQERRNNRSKRLRALEILGNKCVRCGFSDWRALQIDHIKGGGVREAKEHDAWYSLQQVLRGNTEKYQCLCANCNWIKKYENSEHPKHPYKEDIPLAWTDVNLADVKPEGFDPIPEGTYTFSLLPTATLRDRNGVQELNVSASITNGDFTGRRVFFSYPDPTSTDSKGKKRSWSAQALKKLEIALGTEITEGESPVEYLNRVASNGHGTFQATLAKGTYIPEGATEPRVEFKLFSVQPSA